jgi:predicted nuclease with TOPRIM domain
MSDRYSQMIYHLQSALNLSIIDRQEKEERIEELEDKERRLDAALKKSATINNRIAGRIEELEAKLEWLDNNTTFYDTDKSDAPLLASVSRRIWYHATNDTESYPFSRVIKEAPNLAALEEKQDGD